MLLLRTSDLLRERFLRFALPSLATLLAHTPPTTIHGVEFCYSQSDSSSPTELWVTTSQALFGGGRQHAPKPRLTDTGGANPGCTANDAVQLVLGRDEAIYLYGPDDAPCFV